MLIVLLLGLRGVGGLHCFTCSHHVGAKKVSRMLLILFMIKLLIQF